LTADHVIGLFLTIRYGFSGFNFHLWFTTAELIGRFVAGNAHQPGYEWILAAIFSQILHRGQKGLRGQILRVINVAHTEQHVTVDLCGITFI
jgi:hypothetical protein